MASQTTNLHLTLPTGTENVSRQVINNNMNAIDAAVGAVPNGQNLQSQVTNLANESSSLKSALDYVQIDLNELRDQNDDKLDKPHNVLPGKFAQTDEQGNVIWGNPASSSLIDESVKNWLDENIPVGQTVVVDKTLEIENAAAESKTVGEKIKNLQSAFDYVTMPIYIGDFLTTNDYLPSAVVRIEDLFFVFDAHTNAYNQAHNSGIGSLKVFNVETNTKVLEKDILMGHANSACYNPITNRIYIQPSDTYVDGQIIPIAKLYSYNLEFTEMEEIDTPTLPKAVSFDFVNSKMYYCSRTNEIYEFDASDNSWTYYGRIDLSNVDVDITGGGKSYNQDFAVRDNYFYLSTPYGGILYGDMSDADNIKFLKHYTLSNIDVNYIYRIGELEGFEFDPDGHLFACQYTILDGYNRNGFVTEIPITSVPSFSTTAGSLFTENIRSIQLSEASQAKFCLSRGEIRSICQMVMRTSPGDNIVIPENNVVIDDRIVYITADVGIELRGELRIRSFFMYAGQLSINASTQNNKLVCINNSTNALFKGLNRPSDLKIVGEYPLRVDLGQLGDVNSNFINVSFGYPITIIRNNPISLGNQRLMLGSRKLCTSAFMLGTNYINYFSEITFDCETVCCGFVSGAGKSIVFSIDLPNIIPSTADININTLQLVVRGINGYVDCDTDHPILLKDETYTKSYIGHKIKVVITRATAFNVPNNTPLAIQMFGIMTISYN